MDSKDIRWEQRFSNFKKALAKLGEVAAHKTVKDLSELEVEGLIQRFEYTYEWAWNTLQDLLRDKGYNDIAGPNPAIEQAFKDGYINQGEAWRKMKKSRELTSHTYNAETATEIAENVIAIYYRLFMDLCAKLEQERSGKQSDLFDK
ncbi:MAG TPA: nucleotidyltransferase substrate binding protein [Bacteroidia bacterium]|nr:nucleotidyltransferase substrate binding protein [Bacteroidia bacterium]